jgi:branched-chain amino acid transport system substrate-binding protein
MDAESRAWADRFYAETKTRPSFEHAGNYSAALQYLEAVQAAGTDDADDVVARLEGRKLDDVFLRNGEIRARDHSVVHDAYLVRVKKPAEVKEDWDYEEIVTTIPAAKAFPPAEKFGCSL